MNVRPARRSASARNGFTLVEMLIVILLIGVLVALVSVAVMGAVGKGKEAQITVEMGQLTSAIENFKTKYGAYPPGMSTLRDTGGTPEPIDESDDYPAGAATAELEARIMRFIARAFPQYPASNFTSLRDAIGRATLFAPDFSQPVSNAANDPAYAPNPNCCDLYTLDAAEALVLWIGGLPQRTTGTSGQQVFRLTRLAADPTNPFILEASSAGVDASFAAGRQRTEVLFPFEPGRLTDLDADGWPEYIPPGTGPAGTLPPYVYFESTSYDLQPAYPDPDTAGPAINSTGLAAVLSNAGVAKPYARDVTSPIDLLRNNWQVTWINPDSFQLVCSGRDGQYGAAPTATTYIQQATELRDTLRIYPAGKKLIVGNTSAGPTLSSEDADNLTNFASGRLEDGYLEATTP